MSNNKSAKGVALLARGAASCATQATAYGQCVAVSYRDMQRDQCAKEFQAFKDCVQKAVKRKW
ncbi:hypothetical protein BCR43DRAFT_514397 [Syncephalastrum racemosum]|uniref:CHCH domain-containing protein n=1 Tax=Syncephalastrum racemosum TaxID=13706 RepID=A0A1X2HGG8_SYNRA|nr:hypothetical protein BCR43DRAFT_514397 [Syncephalastrum racemosum]